MQRSNASKQNKGTLDEISALKEQLKNGNYKRVYLFSGEERFLLDHYVKELKQNILGNSEESINFSLFEGKTSVHTLMDTCDTYPVFSDKKLVMVRDSGILASRTKKSADDGEEEKEKEAQENDEASQNASDESDSKGSKEQELLKNYLSELPDTTCLIFIEEQFDKRTGLYKAIQKHGLHVHFAYLKPDELVRWVIRGFKQSNKSIAEEAAQYLVSISEPDMYALKNEINKIVLYAQEKNHITIEDVKLMATFNIKSVIFDLMDAVATKNRARALSLLDDMLQLKEPEQKILSMIAKQTGEILKMKKLMASRINNQELTQFFPKKHPYVIKKLTEHAMRIDEKYLEELLRNCMESDYSTKRGRISPRLSLEILFSKI